MLSTETWVPADGCTTSPHGFGDFYACNHTRVYTFGGMFMTYYNGFQTGTGLTNDRGHTIMMLNINGIWSTGPWDLMASSAGTNFGRAVGIRWENPVERIEWVIQPSTNTTNSTYSASTTEMGMPFDMQGGSAPLVHLVLKDEYKNLTALTCDGSGGGNVNGDWNCMTDTQTVACNTSCPRQGNFFIQAAPMHAYYTINGIGAFSADTVDAAINGYNMSGPGSAMIGVTNNAYYGQDPQAFPTVVQNGKWNYWGSVGSVPGMRVGFATASTCFNLNIALSFQLATSAYQIQPAAYDAVSSGPSNPLCSLPSPSQSDLTLQVATQPS